MIKNLSIISFVFFLLTSCSKDNDSASSNVDPSVNPNNISNINIIQVSFQPTISPATLSTFLELGVNNGQANRRTFTLIKNDQTFSTNGDMEIKITYPNSNASINGTYNFINNNLPNNEMATGSFINTNDNYIFKQGAVTITDLGNNFFKITFVNASISPFSSSLQIPVTGYYEGKFF